MGGSLKGMLEGFFRFLFPPYCLGCLKDGPNFCCDTCLQKIERFVDSCPICSHPSSPAKVCGWCLRGSPFDALYIAAPYDQPVLPELLTAFKFEGVLSLAHELGSLLVPLFNDLPKSHPSRLGHAETDILIPLPLSSFRLQERGFNQSELLARTAIQTITAKEHFKFLPLEGGGKEGVICEAWPPTPSPSPQGRGIRILRRRFSFRQSKLSAAERTRNVLGTFSCPHPELVNNKTIVLLDDLYTTGATMAEAAQTLKAAGAKKVIGVALAKG